MSTHIHRHLAIHALPHSTTQAHSHTSGYPCAATQHCARTYTHSWLYMHYHTALCMNIHMWLPSTATQHCVRTYTHIAGYPCTATQHCARTYTHIWLTMHYITTRKHKHVQPLKHAHTKQLATHTLSHSHVLLQTNTSSYPCTTRQPHANTNTLKYARIQTQYKLLSMHCHTALRTHIHTHLAIHALPHSTAQAHTHTSGYLGLPHSTAHAHSHT